MKEAEQLVVEMKALQDSMIELSSDKESMEKKLQELYMLFSAIISAKMYQGYKEDKNFFDQFKD